MGSTTSMVDTCFDRTTDTYGIPIKCYRCHIEYGEDAIFKVYNHPVFTGKTVCVNCYSKSMDPDTGLNLCPSSKSNSETTLDTKSKRKQLLLTCECCKYNIKKYEDYTPCSRPIFKVYWVGKFGDKYMCEKCVYDKKHRKLFSNT